MILLRVAGIWGWVWCAQGAGHKEPAENTALRIMWPDRYSKTLCEKWTSALRHFSHYFDWFVLWCNSIKTKRQVSVGTALLIIFCIDPLRAKSICFTLFYTGRSDTKQLQDVFPSSQGFAVLLKDTSAGRTFFESRPLQISSLLPRI